MPFTTFLKTKYRPIITANQKRLASAEDYLFSGNNDDALVSYLGNSSGGDIWEVRLLSVFFCVIFFNPYVLLYCDDWIFLQIGQGHILHLFSVEF